MAIGAGRGGLAPVLALDKGELVHRQPVVVGWVVEVYHPGLAAPGFGGRDPVLCVDAFDQHPVVGTVVSFQVGTFGMGEPAKGDFQYGDWPVWV